MLTEYVRQAMALAQIEKTEDGRYFASIPDFKELWANADTRTICLTELRSALEEWLVVALREDEELPEVAGITLNFGGKRWHSPLAAES